jgi:hypothetical protein
MSAGIRLEPVGSRVTCDPPPPSGDEDYLVLQTLETQKALSDILNDYSFERVGSEIQDDVNEHPPEERFTSYKYGDVDLIVTASSVFFDRFIAATSVAKRLNLLDKGDRIALFQAVLYGNPCPVNAPVDNEVAF